MSRGYDARRKAKRQQARVAAESPSPRGPARSGRLTTLLPVLVIAAILAVVGILGLGASNGVSETQVAQEVTELLDGVPQRGAVLGSSKAPITVWVYADLECPTVKLFVENYLPSFVETWVRTGAVRLAYRSLETDTLDEKVFFTQEIAALAAGRQDRMWNFLLTFVRQQGPVRTDYVTDEFLANIAAQVPDLRLAKWHRDRRDARLSRQVALGVHSGRTGGLRSTPSFLIGFTPGEVYRRAERVSIRSDVETFLRRDIKALQKEADRDFPTLRAVNQGIGG